MQQSLAILTFDTDGQGFREVTDDVNSWLRATDIRMGQVTLFSQHTSAGLLITESTSPAVRRDLLRWLDLAAPEGDGYEHGSDGLDDMPAHVKAMLTGSALTVPYAEGRMLLGTWQGVYLAEHRARPHRRQVVCYAIGE